MEKAGRIIIKVASIILIIAGVAISLSLIATIMLMPMLASNAEFAEILAQEGLSIAAIEAQYGITLFDSMVDIAVGVLGLIGSGKRNRLFLAKIACVCLGIWFVIIQAMNIASGQLVLVNLALGAVLPILLIAGVVLKSTAYRQEETHGIESVANG